MFSFSLRSNRGFPFATQALQWPGDEPKVVLLSQQSRGKEIEVDVLQTTWNSFPSSDVQWYLPSFVLSMHHFPLWKTAFW
jgi:hypothetical protein